MRMRVLFGVALVAATLATLSGVAGADSSQDTVTAYPVGTPPGTNPNVSSVASGPDGNLWFADGRALGRMTPTGAVTRFPLPAGNGESSLAAGPDGHLWYYAWSDNALGRVAVDGTVTEVPLPSGVFVNRLVAGPDGNIWFTDDLHSLVGRSTPAGQVTMYTPPTANSRPWDITTGSDGNLWFSERGAGKIGRITPAGVITEFPLPEAVPGAITAGPDGNIWVAMDLGGGNIDRVTPQGAVTAFPVARSNSVFYKLVAGPDGGVWYSGDPGFGRVWPSQVSFPLLGPGRPIDMTAGPDGAVWIAREDGGILDRVDIAHASATNLTPSTYTPAFGQPFTVTADVSTPMPVTPTGSVQFSDNGANLGAPVALAGHQAVLTTSGLTPGWHTIRADYSGDAVLNRSTAEFTTVVMIPTTVTAYPAYTPTNLLGAATGMPTFSARVVRTDTGAPLAGQWVSMASWTTVNATTLYGRYYCSATTDVTGVARCTASIVQAPTLPSNPADLVTNPSIVLGPVGGLAGLATSGYHASFPGEYVNYYYAQSDATAPLVGAG